MNKRLMTAFVIGMLGTVPGGKLSNLDDVANADTEGRRVAEEIVARICG